MNSSLMRSLQPTLEQCSNSVDQRQQVVSDVSFLSDNLALIFFCRQFQISIPVIRAHHTARLYRFFHCRCEALSRRIRHAPKPNTPKPITFVFNRDHDQCLHRCTPATFSGPYTPNIRLIDFHNARKTIAARSYHSNSQLVKPCPNRFITAQPQSPLQAQRANAVLLIGDIPYCPKPQPQRLASTLKDRPRNDRYLKITMFTTIKSPLSLPSLSMATSGTAKAIRPTKLEQIIATVLFGSKSLLELKNSLRIIFHAHTIHVALTGVNRIGLLINLRTE